MRIWQGIFLGVLLVPLMLGGPGYADAATVTARSSTVLEWYDDPEGDETLPLYQYLQLSARNLWDSGYSFKVYGRLADDAKNEVEIESRLYYAYLEKKDFLNGLDFRLGRQFISTTAGASMMDGLSLDYAFNKELKSRLFVGGDVRFYDGYNLNDMIGGLELSSSLLDDRLDLGFSYLQKWDAGHLAQELLGFDFSYDWQGRYWLYNELQWDIISERLSYALVGGKFSLAEPLTLRAEYLYSLPVFSSTSIYSVFAVEEYEEIMAELVWKISRQIQAFTRYSLEIYEEFDNADVIEVGVEKLRTGPFSGYLSGIYRNDDDGQDLYGAKAYADYQLMAKLRTGVGANVDVLERDIAYFNSDDKEQNETTSTRIWVDARYAFTKQVSLRGKYEYIESDLWDYYHRGTIRLNIIFR